MFEEESNLEEIHQQYLKKILALIKVRTGRNFNRYKSSTILRRIVRRMQFNRLEKIDAYYEYLKEQIEEQKTLASDLLITVTNFFRDPEMFDVLEKTIIPRLFEGKDINDAIRIWSAGCATGQEAYTLAILLLEESFRREGNAPRLQIFASDLHEHSLEKARLGFFPEEIRSQLTENRLSRFFHKENGGYQIRDELRELIIFTHHNVLSDPPFSKLDLISCRNLLIYLERTAQNELVELFHYSLNPEGCLVLGASETVDGPDLFRVEDKKNSIFIRRNVPAPELRLPVFPLAQAHTVKHTLNYPKEKKNAYGALHHRIVEAYVSPSLIINSENKIIHLSDRAGRYLVLPGGEPSSSIFKLVRQELQLELRTLIPSAREEKRPLISKPIKVLFDGENRNVMLHVCPALGSDAEGVCLIVFEEEKGTSTSNVEAKTSGESDFTKGLIQDLTSELELTKQSLQVIVEEYETTQEEMRATNEELQSANEELRSTMEELETSKEELQSMNEELQTVNQENAHKVEELTHLSSDLQNLLAATEIATIFLDLELRILRFTPKVASFFRLRGSDRGRPLEDITHSLLYSGMLTDATEVLNTLIPIEREVKDEDNSWYIVRIFPYRSTKNQINGIVLTFVNISSQKDMEKKYREAMEYSDDIINTLLDPYLVLNPQLEIQSANQAYYTFFQTEIDVMEGKMLYELGTGQWNTPALRSALEEVLPEQKVFNDFQFTYRFGDSDERELLLSARKLDKADLILLSIRHTPR